MSHYLFWLHFLLQFLNSSLHHIHRVYIIVFLIIRLFFFSSKNEQIESLFFSSFSFINARLRLKQQQQHRHSVIQFRCNRNSFLMRIFSAPSSTESFCYQSTKTIILILTSLKPIIWLEKQRGYQTLYGTTYKFSSTMSGSFSVVQFQYLISESGKKVI